MPQRATFYGHLLVTSDQRGNTLLELREHTSGLTAHIAINKNLPLHVKADHILALLITFEQIKSEVTSGVRVSI